jgi:NAD(P)-dependent dehydrogenase (short-subunit alcohol dehydrogenase family)
MIRRSGGRVVNLSSGTGAEDRAVYSAYAAAKAALFRISGSLHLAGGGQGLRSFDVAPGVVRTEMTSAMAIHQHRTDWTPVQAVVELVVAVAQGRLDTWSGRFLRAGVDTVQSLVEVERAGLADRARRLGVLPYGPTDPLG